MQFKSKLPETGTSIFSVMSLLANEHDAINLSQGFPDFDVDPKLKLFLSEAVDLNEVQYAPSPGRLDLRIAIVKTILTRYDVDVDPYQEVTVVAGATQGIYTAIATVIDQGDEVILFDPAYDCYDPVIRLHKGIPIHLKLKHPTYTIDWDEVENNISKKTKLIIINNPHNPTGTVWSKEDMLALEKLLLKYPNLMVLCDEVYEYIQYRAETISVLSSEIIRNKAFITYSFGKTLHVTGWKLGYVIAPADFTKELRKIHQYLVFCANNSVQYAVAKYLEHNRFQLNLSAFFKAKRDLFLSGIKSSKFNPLPCHGTYFALLDYSEISEMTDVGFAKKMTIEHGVAAIPVSVFYNDKTDNRVVRLCFAKQNETLLKAANLLCKI